MPLKDKDKRREYQKIYQAKWYIKNKEKKDKQNKEWVENNREKQNEYVKKHRDKPSSKNKTHERNKKFKQDNPDYGKNWHQENKSDINKKNKKRMDEDVNYRIIKLTRGRTRQVIKNNEKTGSTIDLLGCSVDFLKERFESMFTTGMTWDLVLKGKIDIDHIIPCAIFDFSKPEAQKFCFHYSNLQPLWKPDNIKKSDKIEMEVLLTLDRNLLNEKTLKKIERYESKLKKQTA